MELDPQLTQDCFTLGRLEDATLLLHRNAAVGWLILVPDTEAVDWHQLDDAEHDRVITQIRKLTGWAADWFDADKMNVATLGNSVRQMHIHMIARHVDDPCWPLPVWGFLDTQRDYDDAALEAIGSALKAALDLMRPATPQGSKS